ncbi:MAG TPA: hypothetical protein VHN99_04625 [Deinococcales bacterium]|nr:hypothetical protein [Deinococcales bacterium]
MSLTPSLDPHRPGHFNPAWDDLPSIEEIDLALGATARAIPERPAKRPTTAQGESLDPTEALAQLEAAQGTLGPAFATLEAVARACLAYATTDRPAPHVLTTLWTLAEMTGLSERTVQRHLLEDAHPWSPAVAHFLDTRMNFDTMPTPGGGQRKVVSGTVIRFFPHGRQSPQARVKRWASRDLAAESEAGRTKPARQQTPCQTTPLDVSSYRSAKEQIVLNNWVFTCIESVSDQIMQENTVNLYDDIAPKHLPDCMRAVLDVDLEIAREKGERLGLARARWVKATARAFALALRDLRFENLWRKLLWTALRVELHAASSAGFHLLKRAFTLALDALHEGQLSRPVAWAIQTIRKEGFSELERDYGSAMIGPPRAQFPQTA